MTWVKDIENRHPVRLGAQQLCQLSYDNDDGIDPIGIYGSAMPANNQYEGSCGGRSFTNYLEARILLQGGTWVEGQQLDGYEFWKQITGGGNPDVGMTFDEMHHNAEVHGWIPPDAEWVKVEPTLRDVAAAVSSGYPVIQGTCYWDGWSRARIDTGEIKDTPTGPDYNQGHATLIMGVECETLDRATGQPAADTWWVTLFNSHGPDNGRYGFLRMSLRTWHDSLLTDALWLVKGDMRAWYESGELDKYMVTHR